MAEEKDKDRDRELIEAIYREKVERARRTPPEEKFFAGFEIFEMAAEVTKSAIRAEHPEADEVRVQELFEERLGRVQRLDSAV